MEMAPSPLGQPAPQLPSPSPLEPNLRNPLPLSAAQEAQVRDLYYKRVRGICDPVIKGAVPASWPDHL
jgi:COX assembly protein 1